MNGGSDGGWRKRVRLCCPDLPPPSWSSFLMIHGSHLFTPHSLQECAQILVVLRQSEDGARGSVCAFDAQLRMSRLDSGGLKRTVVHRLVCVRRVGGEVSEKKQQKPFFCPDVTWMTHKQGRARGAAPRWASGPAADQQPPD